MPKINIICDPGAQASDLTLTAIQNAVNAAHPNNASTIIRDVNGKLVAVEVNLPANTTSQGIANAQAAINGNGGVARHETFPQYPIETHNVTTGLVDMETATVGQTPLQAGFANAMDTAGGTLVVASDGGTTAIGAKSLKATLNAALGSQVSWEHQCTAIKQSVIKRVEFGTNINIPAAPSGVELVVSVGSAPAGFGAALVISDGSPS